MNRRMLCALAITLITASPFAQAQDFPTKPITVIVPFSAGGPTDTVARLLAQSMTNTLKQTVLVENVGGAGGTLEQVASLAQRPTATRFCFTTSASRPPPLFIASSPSTRQRISSRSVS